MKKVVIIAIAMVTLHTTAQRKEADKTPKYSPEQKATLQTKRMALDLDLTSAQQEQVQKLQLEQANIRESQKQKHEAIKKSGDSVRPTREERYNFRIQELDRRIAYKSEMKRILSAEQYERWEKTAKLRKLRHKGKEKKVKRRSRK